MNKNIALITGITGQDGSYLAEFLLAKGYEVHGTIRRSSVDYRERIAHLEGKPNFHLHYADLGDSMSILGVIGKVRPTEIYNVYSGCGCRGCTAYPGGCATAGTQRPVPHLSGLNI